MITLTITGGPSFQVDFTNNMDIRDALQAAYNSPANTSQIVYSLQYYGNPLGYLVNMLNETYDSFVASSSYQPFFYWEILVDGTPIDKGIDNTILTDGNTVEFSYLQYVPETHKNSTLAIKHKQKTSAL